MPTITVRIINSSVNVLFFHCCLFPTLFLLYLLLDIGYSWATTCWHLTTASVSQLDITHYRPAWRFGTFTLVIKPSFYIDEDNWRRKENTPKLKMLVHFRHVLLSLASFYKMSYSAGLIKSSLAQRDQISPRSLGLKVCRQQGLLRGRRQSTLLCSRWGGLQPVRPLLYFQSKHQLLEVKTSWDRVKLIPKQLKCNWINTFVVEMNKTQHPDFVILQSR